MYLFFMGGTARRLQFLVQIWGLRRPSRSVLANVLRSARKSTVRCIGLAEATYLLSSIVAGNVAGASPRTTRYTMPFQW